MVYKCFFSANWVIITYHLLREPETAIDLSSDTYVQLLSGQLRDRFCPTTSEELSLVDWDRGMFLGCNPS